MLPAGYKTTQQCWVEYPKLPFPDNVGKRGAQQKRARDACVAASMQGKPDPELQVGPPILKDYAALWRSAPPWNERPKDNAGLIARAVSRTLDPAGAFGGGKTSGDFTRSQALGWRPVGDGKYVELEHKGTIAGGIDALAALGIAPWVHAYNQLSTLGPIKLHAEDSNGVRLLGVVQVAAVQLGQKQPTSLASAAEFVRAAVNAQQLERPAWVARMGRMLGAGIRAQKTRNAVEQSVSAGLAVAATALNGTVIGAIVGVPLQLASAAFGLASVRTSAEKSRAESLLSRLPIEFEFELQSRANQQQLAAAKQQIALNASSMALDPDVAAESARIQTNVKIGVTLGVASAVTLTLFWLTRRP
jgi:hypothetical protein